MSDFRRRYGPCAVVCGASQGLGAAFSEALAARGLDLVLLARRAGPLDELGARLRGRHPAIAIRTAPVDLGAADAGSAVAAACADREIGLLVHNAAAAGVGAFVDLPLATALSSIDVNCRGPVLLCHQLLPGMIRRKRGGVVLMSSLAASQGSPYIAVYGASKAFGLCFAEALWGELQESGVDVVGVRAGAIRTPNYEASVAGRKDPAPVESPAAVAEQALGALGRGPSVVTGTFNRLAAFVMGRLLPRRLAVRLMGNGTRALM